MKSGLSGHFPVAILAGGQSRRMGTDKANLRRDGRSLLERTVAVTFEAGATSVAIIGRPQPSSWPSTLSGTIFLPDDRPEQGPLGGIETALRWAESRGNSQIYIIPCDLPLLTTDALHWLFQTATDNAPLADGLAIRNANDRIEPLFAVYATQCLPAIAQQLATGRRSPTALIATGDFRQIAPPPFVRDALADADTPEAWAALTGVEL